MWHPLPSDPVAETAAVTLTKRKMIMNSIALFTLILIFTAVNVAHAAAAEDKSPLVTISVHAPTSQRKTDILNEYFAEFCGSESYTFPHPPVSDDAGQGLYSLAPACSLKTPCGKIIKVMLMDVKLDNWTSKEETLKIHKQMLQAMSSAVPISNCMIIDPDKQPGDLHMELLSDASGTGTEKRSAAKTQNNKVPAAPIDDDADSLPTTSESNPLIHIILFCIALMLLFYFHQRM